MTQEKRPRHYASEIMSLDDKEKRRELFDKVPDHLKDLTRRHCEVAVWIKKNR